MNIYDYQLGPDSRSLVELSLGALSRRVATLAASEIQDPKVVPEVEARMGEEKASVEGELTDGGITKFRKNMARCIERASEAFRVECLPGTSLPKSWINDLKPIECRQPQLSIYYTDLDYESLRLKDRCEHLAIGTKGMSAALVFDNTKSCWDEKSLISATGLACLRLPVLVLGKSDQLWINSEEGPLSVEGAPLPVAIKAALVGQVIESFVNKVPRDSGDFFREIQELFKCKVLT